eukprot:CAMPEP_0197193960 /NCGR_PEP_ID=MMETSP1423-20130617/28368_1 /TAXON_ID=476441 /ORGANISM="Pseudo-nitzschia heimii, Strain UNC1101" /LENGTH=204 /DNA_ID=CAMNT_0042647295 /DNA_START=149 /DNA_END=760 /DNA_ORIENTATION=-
MDALRNFFFGKMASDNDAAGYDVNMMNGPTINISPGRIKEDVHYMESRGSIDLSHLRFYSDDYTGSKNVIVNYQSENNKTNTGENESDMHKNSGFSHVEWKESFLDIAVFEVPENCTSRNCDLSKFGIGSLTHFDGNSYLNLCQSGRLRIDQNIFKGHHTQLMIPGEGGMPDRIKQNKNNKFRMPKHRHYEVMLANCNEKGRRV